MSVEKSLREMIRAEVLESLAPVFEAIVRLESQGAILARFSAALGAPIKRGPGRPRKLLTASALTPRTATKPSKRERRNEEADRPCAVKGCKRLARSKGFCAAHYQKFRLLERTGRLPSDWTEYAPPGSIHNVVLPRGRAGAKALAASKRK